MYQISSADLGAYIAVEVTPIDTGEEYSGTAEAKYGPVSLSTKLRQNLEYALATGGSTFTLYLASETLDSQQGRCEVRMVVGREEMELQVFDERGVMDEGGSLKTGYSIEYPSVSLHPFDTKRFTLTVRQKNKVKRVQLMSLTRQNRDLVVLTLRCLAAKKYLINSKTLQDLFTTDGNLQSQGGTVSSPLDLMLEIDRTVRELYSLMKVNDEVVKERNKLKEELRETEDDMRETISSYQNMLAAAAEAPVTEGRWKQELDLAIDQKNKLRRQCAEAQEEIERLRHDLASSLSSLSSVQSQLSSLQAQSTGTSVLEQQLDSQTDLISALTHRLEAFDSLKSDLTAANLKITGQSKMIVELTAQIDDISSLKAENGRLKDELGKVGKTEEEVGRLREENAALLGQRALMARKIDTLSDEVEEGRKKIEELVNLQDETRGRHEKAIQKLLSEIDSIEKSASDSPDVSQQLSSLTSENTHLKSQLDSLSAQLSRAQALARRPTRPDL